MEGYICDRCGAAVFEGERGMLNMVLTTPDDSIVTDGTLDLCPPCSGAIGGIVTSRIITRTTREGAWVRVEGTSSDDAAKSDS